VSEEHENRINLIVREYGDSILRLCRLYLHDYHLAQDAAQESLIKVFRRLDTCKDEANEKAWIMWIVINTYRDYYRTGWFRHVDRYILPEDADRGISFEESLREVQNGEESEVLKAVMDLPRSIREVILLRYYQEMTVHAVAMVLRLSDSAVNKRLRQAKDILKPALWEVYFNE